MARKAIRKMRSAAYSASPTSLTPAQKRSASKKIIDSAGAVPFPPRKGKPRKWMRRINARQFSGV